MASTPRSYCLNRLVLATSAATVDTLADQGSSVGIIGMAVATNEGASPVTLEVFVLPPGTTAAMAGPVWRQRIMPGRSEVLAGLVGQVVPAGGSIAAFASASGVARLTISGSNNV